MIPLLKGLSLPDMETMPFQQGQTSVNSLRFLETEMHQCSIQKIVPRCNYLWTR